MAQFIFSGAGVGRGLLFKDKIALAILSYEVMLISSVVPIFVEYEERCWCGRCPCPCADRFCVIAGMNYTFVLVQSISSTSKA